MTASTDHASCGVGHWLIQGRALIRRASKAKPKPAVTGMPSVTPKCKGKLWALPKIAQNLFSDPPENGVM